MRWLHMFLWRVNWILTFARKVGEHPSRHRCYRLVVSVFALICGPTENLNKSRMADYVTYFPRSCLSEPGWFDLVVLFSVSSVKNIVHWYDATVYESS